MTKDFDGDGHIKNPLAKWQFIRIGTHEIATPLLNFRAGLSKRFEIEINANSDGAAPCQFASVQSNPASQIEHHSPLKIGPQ